MITLKEYIGHIRNWKKLCQELGVDSELPREEREQQIILKAYEKWQGDMANHIYGMFAFALYDDSQDKLFCMRDQFGTKPFYYYMTEDKELLVSTGIRKLLDMPGVKKELNEDLIQIYMTLTYIPGEDTFFKGIKKLLPGRYMEFKKGDETPVITRYFRPEFKPDNSKSLQEYADEIHDTLAEIMTEVKEDGEVAESFLSGGVDSSYVLAMSDAKVANSCGYDFEALDESSLAAKTAELFDRDFNRCLVSPQQFFDIVPWVMYNMEMPLGDASAIVFALGCRATAEHTKLCYSGEGSDEFFGGYNMYRNAERYGDNLKTFYVGNTNIMKEDEKEKILKKYDPSILPINLCKEIYEENEGLAPLEKMQDVDIQIWLEGDIYFNVHNMSTAAGLEVRMPLTDMRIFDIASRLPVEYKVTAEENKLAFRTAALKKLPEEIAFRKKLGFVVPIRYWMADEKYNQDVRDKFKSDIADKFFKKDEIWAIYEEYIGGNSDLWRKVWTIYTFLVWYEEYFTKR